MSYKDEPVTSCCKLGYEHKSCMAVFFKTKLKGQFQEISWLSITLNHSWINGDGKILSGCEMTDCEIEGEGKNNKGGETVW